MLTEAERRQIGGSDVAAICGVSPYAGPLAVYLRIVEGFDRKDGPHLKRGRHLEPAVRAMYCEATGAEVVPDVRLSGLRRPWMRASLDGVAKRGGGRRTLEVKTANGNEAPRWGAEGTDEVPEEYLLQCAWYAGHGLSVGAVDEPVTDVAALVAGDLRVYTLPHDADLFGVVCERVERFWRDHVEAKRPPEPTALPNDVEAVRRAYRRHTREDYARFDALPPEAQVAIEEYARAKAAEDKAKDAREAWETRVRLALAGAPGVTLLPTETGFHRLDWKDEKTGRLNPWTAVEELGRLYSEARRGLGHLRRRELPLLEDVLAKHTGEPNRPLVLRKAPKKEAARLEAEAVVLDELEANG